MGYTPIVRSEEEYFDTLRSLILACICNRTMSTEPQWFHSVDMIKNCAGSFLDKFGVDVYQFSGEHPFYQQVHDEIYRPLVKAGLMVENENNTFAIPAGSRLRNICKNQITKDEFILWEEFWKDVQQTR